MSVPLQSWLTMENVGGFGLVRTRWIGTESEAFGGMVYPARLAAVIDDTRYPRVRMVIAFEDGKPRCRKLRLASRAGKPLTSTSIRIPLDAMVRAACFNAACRLAVSADGTGRLVPVWAAMGPDFNKALLDFGNRHEKAMRRKAPEPIDSRRLKRVATIFEAAKRAGRPTTAAVADALEVSNRTAANLVWQARKAGHLPPTNRKAKP